MSDFERLKMLLEHIGISANRLSKEIGLSSPQVFYDIKAGRCGISKDLARRIQDKYLNIDMAWLLTGTGSMIKDEKAVAVPIPEGALYSVDTLPLVDIKAIGCLVIDGVAAESWGQSGVSVPFMNCEKGDIAVCQYGDSMAPVIPAGSILHIRRVAMWRDYIGYGNDFVIVLNDGRRMTKNIVRYEEDPHNFLLAHSYNSEVGDEALPKDMVAEVWKVISVVSTKGW